MTTKKYRVRNWSDYTRCLKQRGSIEIWINKEIINSPIKKHTGKGRPVEYHDGFIECMLAVKFVYHLALRQLEGFMTDVVNMAKLNCKVPDYTTVCKRQKKLNVKLLNKCKSNKKLYLAVDSSGLKVFGEGEWKVRQHGYSKRRTWKKLHIGLGLLSGNKTRIEVAELTEQNRYDGKVLPELLNKIEGNIGAILGDGAYDAASCYDAAMKRGAKMVVPPRENAKTQFAQALSSPAIKERNKNIISVYRYGKDVWKKKMNYHKRSLVENAFFRLKTIFGGNLASRKFENQQIEAVIKCQILNRMSAIGMPKSYAVA
jgi:hypothetical protein